MHKAFPLPGESSHWQYKFPLPVKVVPTARRLKMQLPEVCTIIEVMMKKLPWEQPSLAVGTYTASGNFLLAVGMPCAFYSQQSSPKLDAPFALKFSRIK
nr:hypothetical protein [Tanacetum cinerariifolium]